MNRLALNLVASLFAYSMIGVAQSQSDSTIGLKCTGTLEKFTDGVVSYEPTSIDVLINPGTATASINGWWGCMSMHETALCTAGTIPVSISGDEIKFLESSNTSSQTSTSGFSINRYTGTFSVNSIASAKPQSGAVWGVIMYSAKLNCTQSQRRF